MVLDSRHKTCPSGTRGDARLPLRSSLGRVYPAKPLCWTGKENDLGEEGDNGKKGAIERDEQRVVPQTKRTAKFISISNGNGSLSEVQPSDVKNTYRESFSANGPRSMGVRTGWSIVYLREFSTSRYGLSLETERTSVVNGQWQRD